MGLSFRKSFRFGPLRVNLSRRGVGYSVGPRHVRVGRDAYGRGYFTAHWLGFLYRKFFRRAK